MKKLAIPVLIAAAAALWASQNPDGLDKTAELLGFAGRAKANPAIMPDYHVHFIHWPWLSTALAGIAGVVAVAGIFIVLVRLFKKYSARN